MLILLTGIFIALLGLSIIFIKDIDLGAMCCGICSVLTVIGIVAMLIVGGKLVAGQTIQDKKRAGQTAQRVT